MPWFALNSGRACSILPISRTDFTGALITLASISIESKNDTSRPRPCPLSFCSTRARLVAWQIFAVPLARLCRDDGGLWAILSGRAVRLDLLSMAVYPCN